MSALQPILSQDCGVPASWTSIDVMKYPSDIPSLSVVGKTLIVDYIMLYIIYSVNIFGEHL